MLDNFNLLRDFFNTTPLGTSSANFKGTIPGNLPAGSRIIYTVDATTSGSASADLINEVEVSLFGEYSDLVSGNNSDSETVKYVIPTP